MKQLRVLSCLEALLALTLLVAAIPAYSQGTTPCPPAPGTKLLVNVVMHVTKDANVGAPMSDPFANTDRGNNGNIWAVDAYNRHIQVWQLTSGLQRNTYCAQVSDSGTFVTVIDPSALCFPRPGASGCNSPGGTGGLDAGITGTMEGGYLLLLEGNFNPTSPLRGNIGQFDGCYPESSSCTPVPWFDLYFSGGYNLTPLKWAWGYDAVINGADEMWIRSWESGGQIQSIGDITTY